MNKDYNDFLNGHEKINSSLDNDTFNMIMKEMNPSIKLIFGKLLLVQGFIGLLTMTFCPQFNLSLTNTYDLFHYFHRIFGHEVCMLICGSIFLGTGAIFASYILSDGEVAKIKQSKFLFFTSISILAASIFMILGTQAYLHLVLYWMIGATISSIGLFELNTGIRRLAQ